MTYFLVFFTVTVVFALGSILSVELETDEELTES